MATQMIMTSTRNATNFTRPISRSVGLRDLLSFRVASTRVRLRTAGDLTAAGLSDDRFADDADGDHGRADDCG